MSVPPDPPVQSVGPPGLELRPARPADRAALQQMLELYQHDLDNAGIWPQELDARACYGYPLQPWFEADAAAQGRHAFVATLHGGWAGFALVSAALRIGPRRPDGRWMDQFWVRARLRRSGIGRALARAVFQALPGHWQVGQMPANAAARAFWRAVIAGHCAAQGWPPHREQRLVDGPWQGLVQCFEPPAR